VQAVAALCVVAASAVGYRAFLALTFNEGKAASLGLRPHRANLALLALIALAVVSSFTSAGSLLVFGLLVGPPATALLFVRRAWVCMIVSVGVGWIAVVAGLLLAQRYDTAAGATMAGVAVGLFFVGLVVQQLRYRVALQAT
jgi:ABC-type Mn2+/Zn2+ transport system permease subunit